VLRHSSARTPPDNDEENELNDALLRFGMHVRAGGNAGLGNGSENVTPQVLEVEAIGRN
jgi:hypothetical protein